MPTIKDSVHNHIEITGVAAELLDTPPVQRLRYVRQLGTVSLVYPSANHTRFEHSLGVYHLMRQAGSHLGLDDRVKRHLEAAAMLHDVGHTAFSHNLEPILEAETGRSHDSIANLLESEAIATILDAHDLSQRQIRSYIHGEGTFGQLLSGELDVDRMDYLIRDAHHTGVPYGTIDPERLLRQLTIVDGDLALMEGNVQSAESLLIARALMNPTVYNHHVSRISKAMLRRALLRLLDDAPAKAVLEPMVNPWERAPQRAHPLRQAADHDVLVALRSNEATADIVSRIVTRDLYKRAVWAERDAVPEDVRAYDLEACRDAERAIAQRADVDPVAVILDVPSRKEFREASSRVIVNGEARRLGHQSPLVSALQANHTSQWRLGVYAPEDRRDRVATAAVEALDLEMGDHLVQEHRQGLHRKLGEFKDQ